MIFQDRTGSNLNRKKIKIISQTPTEIIADIERADTPIIEGTTINASVFNTFQNEIDTANTKAQNAHDLATSASNSATTALSKATEVEANLNTLINSGGQSTNPYPVGSIYTSVKTTSPASLFGGSWEIIKDRVLVGAGNNYSLGDAGGATSHNHTLTSAYAKFYYNNINEANRIVFKSKDGLEAYTTNYQSGNLSSAASYITNTVTSGTVIGGNADTTSSMPPYLAIAMWKRIA